MLRQKAKGKGEMRVNCNVCKLKPISNGKPQGVFIIIISSILLNIMLTDFPLRVDPHYDDGLTTLVWIPRHTRIKDNERANAFANPERENTTGEKTENQLSSSEKISVARKV